MGNRACIFTKEKNAGIYLHWNGGYTSVRAFLDYCKLKGYRQPSQDPRYAMSRLCQVIANFFGGESSVGIGTYQYLDVDNGDNGTYIIGENWQIIEHEYKDGSYDQIDDTDNYYEMLETINSKMPVSEQIPNLMEVLNEQTMREILKNETLTLDEKIEQLKKVGL